MYSPYLSEKFDIFSPQNLEEYVGQKRAKTIARVMIDAAKIERRPLPNILIDGPYGTGKTTLAKIIAKEAGVVPDIVDASSLGKELPFNFFVRPKIIDEVHNLDPVIADSLNIHLDSGKAKIIGCTTNPGDVPAAFKSRLREIHLDLYELSDIRSIINQVAFRKGLVFSKGVIDNIAKRSRLNPRAALSNLAFMFDFMAVEQKSLPSERDLARFFDTLGIDEQGFVERDRRYMKILSTERPVGLHHISAVLGIDPKTIEREIEPYLLQTGKIDRMPRGRIKLKDI